MPSHLFPTPFCDSVITTGQLFTFLHPIVMEVSLWLQQKLRQYRDFHISIWFACNMYASATLWSSQINQSQLFPFAAKLYRSPGCTQSLPCLATCLTPAGLWWLPGFLSSFPQTSSNIVILVLFEQMLFCDNTQHQLLKLNHWEFGNYKTWRRAEHSSERSVTQESWKRTSHSQQLFKSHKSLELLITQAFLPATQAGAVPDLYPRDQSVQWEACAFLPNCTRATPGRDPALLVPV